jgi:uncharacterized damage-inducible protein DinB
MRRAGLNGSPAMRLAIRARRPPCYRRPMTKPIMADAFGHHSWATLRIIDACAGLTPEQLGTTVPGTYGSILETLRHLVGADRSYLALLSDGAVERVDEDALDIPAMRSIVEANGPLWQDVVSRSLDPDRTLIRVHDDGSEVRAPLGIRLAQVVHHGTDHRSQICTALTTLGIEPPLIDLWDYAELDGRLVEVPPTA